MLSTIKYRYLISRQKRIQLRKKILLLILIIILGGCATPYQRMGFRGGYSSQYMGNDVYLITIQVNAYTGSATAYNYFHRRAKEIVKEKGYDGYKVIELRSSTDTVAFQGTVLTKPSVFGRIQCYRKVAAEEPTKEKIAKAPHVEFTVDTMDKAPKRDVRCKDGYAIVIGIEKYRDLPQVEFAQRDAKVVREYLINTMGFPEANIVTLLNERALKTDLAKYFEGWLKNNVNKDSTLFIYYSGHGAPGLKGDKAYLVPYDGDPSYPEKTCYPLDSLYASLNKLLTKEIIVAIDSCFSGAGGRSVIAEGARPIVISVENPMLASGNTVVLTAAAENEIASFYPEAKHGLFTYFFLKGLRGEGDLDGDGWVELKELFDYLKPEVTGIARRMNREQTPVILPSPETLGKRGEYRLTKAK